MHFRIKKLALAFIVFNAFIVSSVKADMLFYYNAAVLPSIISSKNRLPEPDLVSITLNIPDSIDVNQSALLSAIGNYSDSSSKDITNLVTWSSSNASIASIAGTTITGNIEGNVTIAASLNDTVQYAQIEVLPIPYIWWNDMSIESFSSAMIVDNGYVQPGSWRQFLLINKSTSSSLKVIKLYGTDSTGEVFLNQSLNDDLSVGQGVGYTVTLNSEVHQPIVSYEVRDTITGITKSFPANFISGDTMPTPNNLPVANAGEDLSVEVGKPIVISGSGTDDDGEIVSYEWRKATTQLTSTASFVYTSAIVGIDTLTLTVTDSDGATASDSVNVTVTEPLPNRSPVADAGIDQSIIVNRSIDIEGTATDSDGTITSYKWEKGNELLATTASFTYTSDSIGTEVLTFTATDNDGDSSSDTMTLEVIANNIPIAKAGDDQNVLVGDTVSLDGTNSFDDDQDSITYQWSLSSPSGSLSILIGDTTGTPTFIADMSGIYTIQLIVNDGQDNSLPDSLQVNAEMPNEPPVANAGSDGEIARYSKVYLDGSGSYDPEGEQITYRWILQKPYGSNAVLSDAADVSPTFIADINGEYHLELIVNDGTQDSSPVNIIITASTQYWKIDGQNIVPTYEEQIPEVPAVPTF